MKRFKSFNNFFSLCKVDLVYYQKKGRHFELIYRNPTFEWCAFIKEKKTVLERCYFLVFRYLFPELSKKCPISGHYEYTNLKMGKQFIKLADDGIYRLTVKVTDGERFNHAYIVVVFKIED